MLVSKDSNAHPFLVERVRRDVKGLTLQTGVKLKKKKKSGLTNF
jgi:hypothetical protein